MGMPTAASPIHIHTRSQTIWLRPNQQTATPIRNEIFTSPAPNLPLEPRRLPERFRRERHLRTSASTSGRASFDAAQRLRRAPRSAGSPRQEAIRNASFLEVDDARHGHGDEEAAIAGTVASQSTRNPYTTEAAAANATRSLQTCDCELTRRSVCPCVSAVTRSP